MNTMFGRILLFVVCLIIGYVGIYFFKNRSSTVENVAAYSEVGKKFADALFAEQYIEAYALTGKFFQSRFSATDFSQNWQQAFQQYGKAIKSPSGDDQCYFSVQSIQPSTGNELTQAMVKSCYLADFALEVDEDGGVVRCYNVSAALGDEDGEPRVLYAEHRWCD